MQLDKDEREIYKLLIEDWKNEEVLYKEEATALAQFRLHLATTIASKIFTPLSTKDLSLYGMMKELKEEYSPTTVEQQEDVMRRYYALKRYPKGRDLCEWIDDWIQIEKDLKEAKCFEWGLILKDFQEIQHQVDHGYASTFEQEIDDGKIAFEDLAKRYRRYYKKNSYKPYSSRSSFQATLNNQGVDEPTNEPPTAQGNSKKNSGIRPCVCSKKHRFSTCFYLLPHLRPDGWQEDPEVRQKINDTLARNERLRKGVEKAVREAENPPPNPSTATPPMKRFGLSTTLARENPSIPTNPPMNSLNARYMTPSLSAPSTKRSAFFHASVFRATASKTPQFDHPLQRSVISDTGADTHVWNHYLADRLVNVRPAGPNDVLYHGNTSTPIEAFGDAFFLTQNEDGSVEEQPLLDVAYVPSFHTNIVSLTRAANAGVDFESFDQQRKMRLRRGDDTVAIAMRHENQWVLEHHAVTFTAEGDVSNPSTFAFLKSSDPLVSSATFDRWRTRMAWPSEESISHLERAATGVEISDLSHVQALQYEKPRNESYELANPKRLVSRRNQHQRPSQPFEHVWIDIIVYSNPGFDGTTGILHYYCPFSGIHIVERLYKKSDINDAIPATVHYIERQFDCFVKELHGDDEQALSNEFFAWINRTGRRFCKSAPYTHEQAGMIERAHRTLSEKQRFLRIEAKLPEDLFPECWSTAAYLAN